MGDEKYRMSGSIGSMNCERVLQVQSRTREVMDPFGIAAVVITESGGLDIAKSSEKPSNKDPPHQQAIAAWTFRPDEPHAKPTVRNALTNTATSLRRAASAHRPAVRCAATGSCRPIHSSTSGGVALRLSGMSAMRPCSGSVATASSTVCMTSRVRAISTAVLTASSKLSA